MRVVGLAHDVVLADLVEAGDAVVVLDEAAEDVVAERLPDVELVQVDVGGGVVHELLAPHHPVPLLVEHLLGPLEEVRHPADLALGQGDLQVRVPLEHAR